MMTLYSYWRSSASYRIRIALAMKGVKVNYVPINLREGEQKQSEHLTRNPQGFVPVLELEDGTQLTQSLAILDFLDVTYPEPELMPQDTILRSKILSASLAISSDIAPIQNLSVLNYLRAEYGACDAKIKEWAAHWITRGFTALEKVAELHTTPFLMTDVPTFFECCLVPQVYNARRFGVDMKPFPKLTAIDARCRTRPDFKKAAPENQRDAINNVI